MILTMMHIVTHYERIINALVRPREQQMDKDTAA